MQTVPCRSHGALQITRYLADHTVPCRSHGTLQITRYLADHTAQDTGQWLLDWLGSESNS